jgi:hypothetical protein
MGKIDTKAHVVADHLQDESAKLSLADPVRGA